MENPQPRTPNGRRTFKRGLFRNGVWHCDCETRLPADKFQVKNGGKNHGRWFYTCQKPQPKRCSFFLWSDEAKVREEAAVLQNSRSEPQHQLIPPPPQSPKTPKKQQKIGPLLTPKSKADAEIGHSAKKTNAVDIENEEDFGWSSSADEELVAVASSVTRQPPEDESPRKIAKLSEFDSPEKLTASKTQKDGASNISNTWLSKDDVFTTPSTLAKSNVQASDSHFLLKTPTSPDRTVRAESDDPPLSSLANEVLRILAPIRSHIPSVTERELVDLLNRHDLKAHGIAKGREITRLAVQAKDKKIAELEARITGLEGEKETSRTVIAHLKQDIATSPKKPSKARPEPTRSEV